MLAKELILKELADMKGEEALKTLEYIQLLKKARQAYHSKRVLNDGYLDVRDALKTIDESMSQFIIDERQDRV